MERMKRIIGINVEDAGYVQQGLNRRFQRALLQRDFSYSAGTRIFAIFNSRR
jgi:hypothetical protein